MAEKPTAKKPTAEETKSDDPTRQSAEPVAVIDIGSTSIRMAIGQVDEQGAVRTLETLSQAVGLGKDTFTTGIIEKATIEDCVRVLKSYNQILREYQIIQPDQIRVVATSAVREAGNRLAFVDRIYSATGILIDPIDDAEVNRITYLGTQPYLKSEPLSSASSTIIIEVGGGSTELLLVENEDVVYSHTFRLGSLRLRETLEAYRAPMVNLRNVMTSQIQRTVDQLLQHVPSEGQAEMIALGGDVRFAASHLLADWDPETLGQLPVAELESFSDQMLGLSVDELVHKYHLAFPDAETLAPALLAYVQIAKSLGIETILVSNVNLRDGLLKEVAVKGAWTEDFVQQIIRSAMVLARKYDIDEAHARHVAELSKTLFRALESEHQLDPRYETILYVAALLHEIGLYVSNNSYHKHSMYLVKNGEIFGLGHRDVTLVAMVARYHRRSLPKPSHAAFATLEREQRIAVAKMAAILRVADALDDSHSQRVQHLECVRENGPLVISISDVEDLSLEQLALNQKGTFFEEIFGMPVLLRRVRPKTT